MVKAEPLERQIAHYVSGMRLPPQYVDGVAEELRQRQSPSVDVAKLRREIERWRRLYVLGEIDERRLKRELTPLKGRLADADRPLVDIHRALSYLRDVGSLWAESPRHLQREFVHEVFDRIEVEGPDIMAITPKDTFSLLFAIDRRERYGGVMELIRPTASR
jgi:hypothetical protein